MLQCVSSFLKRLAYKVVDLETRIKNIPKKLQLMADFLNTEPVAHYTSQSYTAPGNKKILDIPLTLDDKALESFKATTKEFPELFDKGIAGQSKMNYIYAIGQFLTDIATVLDIYDLKNNAVLEKALKKLYSLWGSKSSMNGRSLSNKLNKKSHEEAISFFKGKLEKSKNYLEKDIIPLIPITKKNEKSQ